jgi:cytochrome c peroxidase
VKYIPSFAIAIAAALLAGCGPVAEDGSDTAATDETPAPQASSLQARAGQMFEPLPADPPPLEGHDALSAEQVELGRMLFFEPRLSSSWLISCNTCHNVGLGGVDLMETSIGHGWQSGPRNAPTVLNARYNLAQFWDGRAADLAEQAMGPVQAAVEMNNTPDRAVRTLASIPEYVERFADAFPDDLDPVTFENMAEAIEAFEATLITPDAPFDRYLTGDETALTDDEKAGLELFMDKGCGACHGGINIGGSGYFPFGVIEKPDADVLPPDDLGRFEVTRSPGDEYVFKSPTLRNVELTAPFFHSGKVWELTDAVAIMGSAQLGATLTADETLAIATFLASLTGTQPDVTYPILPRHTDATPKPFTDVAPVGASD